jgi:hypothetical protein
VGSTLGLLPQAELGDYALAVDTAGNAIVTVYEASANCPFSFYAPPAEGQDCIPEERTTLRVFDAELKQLGAPLALRALTSPHVASGIPGALTIAGTATTYAKFGTAEYLAAYRPDWVVANTSLSPRPVAVRSHGVLTRVQDGVPAWMQSNAASTDKEGIANVLDLTVDASGSSFILAGHGHGPTAGTNFSYEFSTLSRFGARGDHQWNRKLPEGESYTQLVENADGGVIVHVPKETVDTTQSRVLSISRDGNLIWSYRIPIDQGVAIDKDSGRTIALTRKSDVDGVAQGYSLSAISKDGASCQTYGIPQGDAGDIAGVLSGISVASPFVYLQSETGIRRYRLPPE